tara:strand:- start:1466 stop:2197 length:732 start_codon:yes stop_codon:yes gene_type:complete
MNIKIFTLIKEKLKDSLNLPKHLALHESLGEDTIISTLPWTPARYEKFKASVQDILELEDSFEGSINDISDRFDIMYSNRFFGEVWKPNTDKFTYTGWQLAEEITKLKPQRVLDVGCGYNQFKPRIPNLLGIDPYNNCADYQVDILEFADTPESYDAIMALGSINFNSKNDIQQRLDVCLKLLKPGGKMFFRVNPGISHIKGPWIQIFPWSFEIVQEFAKQYNLTLETYKKDHNNRLYFVYKK